MTSYIGLTWGATPWGGRRDGGRASHTLEGRRGGHVGK